jgi:hypothetical protein
MECLSREGAMSCVCSLAVATVLMMMPGATWNIEKPLFDSAEAVDGLPDD